MPDAPVVANNTPLAALWAIRRLLLAKEQGLVEAVGPIIDDLRATGLYLSPDLVGKVLNLAEES